MAWLDAAEFRELHVTESATEINAAQIGECLNAAKSLIADWCGESVLAEIETASNELRKTDKLRRAQRKLAYRELLEFMSKRSRDGGIQLTERDANGDTTNTYLTPAQIKTARDDLKGEAAELAAPYFTVNEQIENRRAHSTSVPVTPYW